MNSSLKFRLFFMMVMEIAIWGSWQVKIFPYMGMLGFTTAQQAWVGSVFGIASLVGIFFSNQFADRNFSAERFLAASHVIGGIALLITAYATSFWAFFSAFLVYGLIYVPTISVTNSLAFANLANPARDFGFVRVGGTVGWVAVSWPFIFLLSAHAGVGETKWVFIVAALLSFALAGYSLTLPHTPARTNASGVERVAWLKALRLLLQPYVFVLFAATFIDSTIHNGYFVVIDGFLQRVGISSNMSMVVSSLGQVAEIGTMLILGRVLLRLGWKWTLLVGILGQVARFGVFAFFQESPWLIVCIQVLHGICYAFYFVTVYIFVDATFPKDVRSSAQGLFNLLILGLGMVAASQVFPRLAAAYSENGVVNYHQLFLVPTGLALAGILLLGLFFHPPSRGPASAPSN